VVDDTETQAARFARALETVGKINGPGAEKIADTLKDIAPDFHRIIMSFAYGDIASRPGLDLRSREIAVIAALAALGNARPQLEAHIVGGLNAGLSRTEIVEVLMQIGVYAGVPASLNALVAARSAFATVDCTT
jgi:4-carboxymuconolactone decarboxylase